MLLTAAAAFLLASVGSAYAAPSFDKIKKDDEIKNPAAADAALAKDEAKDAKKSAHHAKKKAKVAEHKAKSAEKAAEKATAQ
jgi:hypothetical protein